MTQVRSQDLVLEVSQQSAFESGPYERFLVQLTNPGGQQQYDALQVALRYLFGGHYETLEQLADENWQRNERIREHYGHQRERYDALQDFAAMLAGSIDHATGTGKSYLIFGAAAIALASRQVDRVLVLAPSKTIEEGLTLKFNQLAHDHTLMELLPADSVVRSPAVVNAYEGTVPVGSICVENIHAAYERSLSSIRDSFEGAGERTLVINDEAHHVYTLTKGSGKKQIKEWLAFLQDPKFGFRRVLNVSGTCFIDNNYFPDVIHRYSLQQALADRRIKDVRYWDSTKEFGSPLERWSAVLENHQKNQALYPKVKPITIFVTDKVAKAKAIHAEFTEFIAQSVGIDGGVTGARTLVVSSHKEHEPNLDLLRTVDQSDNEVEFIFSVSMLTEGWDVKNVLQIVPHEKRAFDSKLLISQVLGRGLRLLAAPYGADAQVIVFNHAKWAHEMRRLFEDVWEDDQRVVSTAIEGSDRHFELDQLQIKRGPAPAEPPPAQGRAAGEQLSLLPQRVRETTGFLVDPHGNRIERRYKYLEPTQPLSDILAEVAAQSAAAEIETGEARPDETERLRDEILTALRAARVPDEDVSDTNIERILQWLRPAVHGPRTGFKTVSEMLTTRSTNELGSQSVGRNQLRRFATIALRADNHRAIRLPEHDAKQYDLLDSLLDDPELPRGAIIEVPNESKWRTPVDVVIVSYEPERRFLQQLINRVDECGIDAWIKSPDSGFYAVPYALTRNGVTRNLSFNPDWFLRVDDDVLVIETKMDNDASDENRAKLKSATTYFENVNRLRHSRPGSYHFCFVSPSDYTAFFDHVGARTYAVDFLSMLQAQLR